MADITKCGDELCPMKDKCRRYNAKENDYWQSWFSESPRDGDKCDMFWGDQSEAIFNQLKDILNGEEK